MEKDITGFLNDVILKIQDFEDADPERMLVVGSLVMLRLMQLNKTSEYGYETPIFGFECKIDKKPAIKH